MRSCSSFILHPSSLRRRGFSFTEVLFAVMILGIGFIMVAAIFPVAINQAKTSTEETTGAAVSRAAVSYLEKIASNSTMPATDNVVVGPDYDGLPPYPAAPAVDVDSDNVTISGVLRGSMVMAGDSRYAWVPLYRRAGNPASRDTWSPFAQVFMIPVLARAQSEYRSPDARLAASPLIGQKTSGVPGTAALVGDIVDGLNGAPDIIAFTAGDLNILSEGAYVIVADARQGSGAVKWNTSVAPKLNGLIYRLGNRVPSGSSQPSDRWELMPGYDFQPIRIDADSSRTNGKPPTPQDGKETVITGMTSVSFFVVGRALSPADVSGNTREGAAQDVTAYTTFVVVK